MKRWPREGHRVGATPTVYFIDDSATMREVIKIAFRRENINVVAYNDAASALAQFESAKPDVVITDVIMPDKDGYEVCQFIKQHASLSHTPVILMSGVVNRSVAEKAFSVKADELIRKPFQPQDLITRVRHLLQPGAPVATPPAVAAATAAATLSSIFQAPAAAAGAPRAPRPVQAPAPPPPVAFPPAAAAPQIPVPAAPRPVAAAPAPAPVPVRPAAVPSSSMSASADIPKLRLEVMRLEGLVKKLQSELAAEREYARALEEHVKTLQESE
jgi:CheY-like chemotaxis protein